MLNIMDGQTIMSGSPELTVPCPWRYYFSSIKNPSLVAKLIYNSVYPSVSPCVCPSATFRGKGCFLGCYFTK